MPLLCVPVYLPAVNGPPLPPARRPPPPFRVPRPRRRPGGVVASLVLHALILLSLVRFGVDWITGSGAGDSIGPRGGGGGGGGQSTRYVELPPLPPPTPEAARFAPVPTVVPPQPVPVKSETPVPDLSLVPPAALTGVPTTGPAAGTGPGQGPGSGGGTGGGTGGGVGTDSGPGRGGSGEYIRLPDPRTVLLPAQCASGQFTVRFWVEADGSVSRVNVEPLPKNSACRREWQERMSGYQFYPARTRDGRAVPYVYPVHFTVNR